MTSSEVYGSYGYSLKGKENKEEENVESIKALEELLNLYKDRNYKQSVFIDKFEEVSALIADLSPECQEEDKETNKCKGGLLLLYDVIIYKEIKRRKNVYTHSAGSRDGQDCLNFMFDLINDCAGYTSKYYTEHFQRVTYEQLV